MIIENNVEARYFMSKKKKSYITYGIILTVSILAIIIIAWNSLTHVEYSYVADSGEEYKISINYNSGKAAVEKISQYSAVDFDDTTESNGEEYGTIEKSYTIKITKDERRRFKEAIVIDKKSALDALVCISEDDAVFIENIANSVYDFDGNSQVTKREYGDYILMEIVND